MIVGHLSRGQIRYHARQKWSFGLSWLLKIRVKRQILMTFLLFHCNQWYCLSPPGIMAGWIPQGLHDSMTAFGNHCFSVRLTHELSLKFPGFFSYHMQNSPYMYIMYIVALGHNCRQNNFARMHCRQRAGTTNSGSSRHWMLSWSWWHLGTSCGFSKVSNSIPRSGGKYVRGNPWNSGKIMEHVKEKLAIPWRTMAHHGVIG